MAAANIFHFFEISYPLAKQACIDAGVPMRPVRLGTQWQRREPTYNQAAEDKRLNDRLDSGQGKGFPGGALRGGKPPPRHPLVLALRLSSIGAAPMEFDGEGVCMGCRMSQMKKNIPPQEWTKRHEALVEILERNRCRDGSRHDCVIAVSGGKDSYFQTHVIKNLLGFNPLLVTYDGNNWTPTGWRNLLKMSEDLRGRSHHFAPPRSMHAGKSSIASPSRRWAI